MIKAIVLDIDGVIIGNLPGVNFPQPSKKVTEVLKKIHDSGIPVSFLTGKTTFAAWENIKSIGINNPHIADGGAVIFNPIQNKIIKKDLINSKDLLKFMDALGKEAYVNFFTIDNYFLQKKLQNEYTKTYGKFIGKSPILVDDIEHVIRNQEISKFNISAFTDLEKERITRVLDNFSDKFNFSWSSGPNTGEVKTAVVTTKKSSKKSGVKYLSEYLGVSLDEVLGVGDTIHDWDFIEICGYKGVMGNGTEELKEKLDKTDQRHFIGGHINEDGIIDIFKKFNLI
jgi:HAD superfamily hydrolase (TIGR01484 family)